MVRQCIHHVLLPTDLATQACGPRQAGPAGIVLAPALACPDRETPAHYAAAEACWPRRTTVVQPMLTPLSQAVLRRLTVGGAPRCSGGTCVIRQRWTTWVNG